MTGKRKEPPPPPALWTTIVWGGVVALGFAVMVYASAITAEFVNGNV